MFSLIMVKGFAVRIHMHTKHSIRGEGIQTCATEHRTRDQEIEAVGCAAQHASCRPAQQQAAPVLCEQQMTPVPLNVHSTSKRVLHNMSALLDRADSDTALHL